MNQRRGIRWTTAKGFLKPVLKRPNLAVETHAQVLKLHLEGKRVAGVVFRRPDGTEAYAAAGEVVLAAGAVGSPAILQLSGIGPADLLAAHGVAVGARPAGGRARTCRTICSCAWSTRSRACRP